MVYHGSPYSNLKYIEYNKSTHQINAIYASYNLVIAMMFMGRGNGDLDTVKGLFKDDIPYIVERRKGILDKLYNHDGYIYELDDVTFSYYDYLWKGEVISFETKIKVENKKYYKNILESLLDEEKNGNIMIYKYPNRPNFIPLDNSDLVDKYIGFYNSGNEHAINDLLSIYPELAHQVTTRLNKTL